MENPKQSKQEIFLTYLQTKHFLFRGGGGFFSFTLPKHFCVFSGKLCCNETTAPRDLSGGLGSSFDAQDKSLWKIPKQSRARDFPHLPANQNTSSSAAAEASSPSLSRSTSAFSPGKICCNETTAPRDLMQRDDGAKRSVRWPWILLEL
ncbi:uncharacterized protein G2W53_015161 [Senna tora]|uniref:Uncharacterized protein n=1 Tax=Senna tora TaxID=362788 RepID=A0A834WVI1_9FABA|nr:uncharacterized protein G2W53_015161 [Senna tora]